MIFTPILAALDVTNPALFLALAFCAALTTAISKAGFGGAVAIGIPILLLVTTPRVALGITLPILLLIDVWVLYAMRNKINHQLLLIMTIFGMAGHGIGWAFFDYISNDMLTAFIGGMSVLTAILFFKRQFSPAPQSAPATYAASNMWRRGAFWCSLSGISSFISVTGGIPLQIYLLPYKLPRAFYVGTAAAFFFFLNLSKLPLYWDLGILNMDVIMLAALLLPAIPLGVLLGKKINQLLTDRQFYFALHVILGITGAKLMIDLFG
jgi:uncharacterized membrane protein YfcA